MANGFIESVLHCVRINVENFIIVMFSESLRSTFGLID